MNIIDNDKLVKYGCYYEIETGMTPDECVFDKGEISECMFAVHFKEEGKTKIDCEFYQII